MTFVPDSKPPPRAGRGYNRRLNIVMLGTVAVLLYLGLEWLFLITKPSFTGPLSTFDKISLLTTGFLLVGIPVAATLALVSTVSSRSATLGVAAILGCLLFLMTDNFMYTVMHFGTLNAPGWSRPVFTIALVVFVWVSYRQLKCYRLSHPRLLLGLFVVTGVVSCVSLVDRAVAYDLELLKGVTAPEQQPAVRPNVLFVGFDAVEADILSAYGSSYDTTPFLASIRHEFLMFENAFPDSGKTTGSTTALLSGRSPLDTKVGFPPQVLLGNDSFLHLPALLNRLGYRGYQFAVKYYGDSVDLNLRNSFSVVNGQRPVFESAGNARWLQLLNNDLFFLQRLWERLSKRLKYVFFLEDMLNHFLVVQENLGLGYQYDLDGLRDFEDFVKTADGPFYAHLHFMSTHCCKPSPVAHVFTTRDFPELVERAAQNAADRLNAIRDMDTLLTLLYRFLEESDQLEETILVLYSDHSYNWDSIQRIPFMIRFPNASPAGYVSQNVQLSMAPSMVLDYMQTERPSWMLQGPPPFTAASQRQNSLGPPLYGISSFAYRRHELGTGGLSRITNPGPPYYGIREISVILCSRWYKVSLGEGLIATDSVYGHTAPCPEFAYPDINEVGKHIAGRLSEAGIGWKGSP